MALPDNPISREEHYLSAIAGEETPLPAAPITREEHYLAKIAGEDVNTPRPITRKEHYLDYIAEHGSGGGGGGGVWDGGVIFIDYDGAELERWHSAEVASKTALPDNPTNHPRLVAQGWNWTLAEVKDYIADYPDANVWVGQMYKTASGLTEFDISLNKATGLAVTCNMVGNKDWGDGTQNALTSHTYADYGNYTIGCDGTILPSGTSSAGGVFGQNSSNRNAFWCTAIYCGENVVSIGGDALNYCAALKEVSLSRGISSIGSYSLANCFVLSSFTFPVSVNRIEERTFNSCYGITNMSICPSVTYIGGRAFGYCCFSSVTLPTGITSINDNLFVDCRVLNCAYICSEITEISQNSFSGCNKLETVICRSHVASISGAAFQKCYAVIIYDFSAVASVPNLSASTAFANINGQCKIIVPDALYDNWIVATNWATYADYIYKASEVSA